MRSRSRSFLPCTLALALSLLRPAVVRAAEGDADSERRLALGLKVGLIPPVLATGEVLLRPVPHLALGVFGIVTGGGIGKGGTRVTLGGEAIYEFEVARRSSAYVSGSYAYYHAAREPNGDFETSQMLYATAGYTWKWSRVDVYLGGGLLVLLSDKTPPCRDWGCLDFIDLPFLLPTVEAGVRYAF